MRHIKTYLFELLAEITKSLPNQQVFSTPQGTRYTNDGLITYIIHEETKQLYKVTLKETTVQEELGFFKKKEEGRL
jgi:hypothetical protein